MTTFARIENGEAVEVGVQDYPPVNDDGSPDKRWQEIKDGVGVGWTTADGGKTWQEPPAPPQPPSLNVDITAEQHAAAVQTLQDALDPSAPDPSLAAQVQALAVLVASGPLPGP